MSWVVPGLVNSLGRSSWKTLESTPFFLLQKNEPTRTLKKPQRPFRVVTARFPHYKIAEADDAESLMDAISFLTHNILPQVEGKKTSKKIAKWLKLWHSGLVKIDYTLGSKDEDEGHDDRSTSASETDGESDDGVPAEAETSNSAWYTQRKKGRANATERLPEDSLLLRDTGTETENAFPLSSFANRRKSEGAKEPYPLHDVRYGHSRQENASEKESGSPVDSLTEATDSSGSLSGERKVTQERAARFSNHHRTRSDASSVKVKPRPRTTSLPTAPSVSLRSTNDFSSLPEHTTWSAWANMPLESFQQWVGIPPEAIYPTSTRNTASSATAGLAGANKNTNRARTQENLTFFEIPFQFVTLLSYPEDDSISGSRPPFHVLREVALVRQRRLVLLGLTLFTLLLRFSSPDFFCVLLALCNWVGLYLLKNSRKVNVTLAKRSVRQRVGWAKQWANGLFWRRGNAQPNNSTVNATPTKQGTSTTSQQINEEKTKGYVLNIQGNLHGGLRPPSGKSSANSNSSAQRLILRSGNLPGHSTGHISDTAVETMGAKSRSQLHIHRSFDTADGIRARNTVSVNEASSAFALPKSSSPLYLTSPSISSPYESPPSSANQRTGQSRQSQAPLLLSTPRTSASSCVPGTTPMSGSSSASTSSSPGAGPQSDIPTNSLVTTKRSGFFRKAVEAKLLPSGSTLKGNAAEKAIPDANSPSPPWSDVHSSANSVAGSHDVLSDPATTATASASTTKRRFFLPRRNARTQNNKPVATPSNATNMEPAMPDNVDKNFKVNDIPPSGNLGHRVAIIQESGGEVPHEGESQERDPRKSKEKEEKRTSGGLWRLRRSSVVSSPEPSDSPSPVPVQSVSTVPDDGSLQMQLSVPDRRADVDENRDQVFTDLETTPNADPVAESESKLSSTISGLGIRLAVEEAESTAPVHDSGHSQ